MSITSYKTGNTSPSSLLAGNAAYDPTIYLEYLVIAGGAGGGGNGAAGGGGAGGYRTASNFSVTIGNNYTVTGGGGGAGSGGGTGSVAYTTLTVLPGVI